MLREVHPAAETIFRETYFVEFLDLKCEVASKRQGDRINGPRDGYRLQRHEYEELQRLRGVERRFRQITQLQAEIAALIEASIPNKTAVKGDDE